MTGTKIAMVFSLVGLVGVIESDHIEAWGKLAATPVLGAVIVALLYFHQRNHRDTLDTHKQVCENIAGQVAQIREDNKEFQASQIETLKQAIEK